MSEVAEGVKPDRPALPRDGFRSQRAAATGAAPAVPVVVTPDYGDGVRLPSGSSHDAEHRLVPVRATAQPRTPRTKQATTRNPFEAYGERSSSRPYALRLPDAIDFVLRQMAAEERTHPLRVIDRILHDHLRRAGRLPPSQGV